MTVDAVRTPETTIWAIEDRMLVAQALEGGVPIVTLDPEIARYPVQTIW